MNLELYVKNRNAFPIDELNRYAGQHIAWSPDGMQILASDPDPLKVLAAVKALGYDPAETPIEDIPNEDRFPGGGLFFQTSDRHDRPHSAELPLCAGGDPHQRRCP